MYYDMQGRKIDMMEFVRLYDRKGNGPDPRRVGLSENCFWRISTVLLGLDHAYGGGPPVIFETMVFTRWMTWRPGVKSGPFKLPAYRSHDSVDEQRYSTLAQAKGGHIDMVHKWSGWNGFKRFVAYLMGFSS
jgi:hypothetical protein